MTEENKNTTDNLNQNQKNETNGQTEPLKKTTQILKTAQAAGREIFTAAHLKKAAVIAAAAVIIVGGGNHFLHQQKAQAHARAIQAQSNLLRNLAAQKGQAIVSEDEVRQKAAELIGTEVDAVNFRSVALTAPCFDQDDKDKRPNKHFSQKKKQKMGKKPPEQKEQPQDKEFRGGDDRRQLSGMIMGEMPLSREQDSRGEQPQLDRQHKKPARQAGAPERQPKMPNGQPGMSEQPQTAKADPSKLGKMPLFYKVNCSKDQVNYQFLINAADGTVLRSQAKPASWASSFGFGPK